MPSPSHHPELESAQLGEARLIPGGADTFHDRKKPPQSTRSFAATNVRRMPVEPALQYADHLLDLLIPGPFHRRHAGGWLRAIAADFVLVGVNWLLIGALLVPLRAFFPFIRTFRYAAGTPLSLLGVAILHAALITLMGYTESLYSAASDLDRQARALGRSILWATTLLWLAFLMQGAPWTTSALIWVAGSFHFVALLAWRWQNARQGEHSRAVRNVLIVGAGSVGRRVAAHLAQHPEAGKSVYGFLDDEEGLASPILGRVSDLARVARRGFVDEVILAAPRDRNLALETVREAQRLRLDVQIVPELFGYKPAKAVEQVGDLPVICLHAERLPDAALTLKRCVDVVGASVALILLSPLLAVVAGLIKLDSKGPVLYRAPRAGRKGHLFRCYKFRTMVRNADTLKDSLRRSNERSGPFFKMADDPRITRLGHALRRYSLDELPQLWNVFKGDMSLVGPRPHPVDDYAAYAIEHLARLDVTPGMTGLWQVTARRDPSFQRGMELDVEYIRTWSLASDLRILLKTFVAVARGGGD